MGLKVGDSRGLPPGAMKSIMELKFLVLVIAVLGLSTRLADASLLVSTRQHSLTNKSFAHFSKHMAWLHSKSFIQKDVDNDDSDSDQELEAEVKEAQAAAAAMESGGSEDKTADEKDEKHASDEDHSEEKTKEKKTVDKNPKEKKKKKKKKKKK